MSEEPKKPRKRPRLIRVFEIDWSESDQHQDEAILFTSNGHEHRRCTITPLGELLLPHDEGEER